ncbi:MAG: hypothetical protein OEM82_07490 [Acidobacteriota bacterium]|nr:hypothetical protein [Acidobacteriota bacterium]MDH3529837.1 hypothetical protein [Acidobacteriota bacterium]
MNEPLVDCTVELDNDISWAVNFLEVIKGIRHSNEAKIRAVNLLVEEEAKIQMQPREMLPR